MSRPVVSVSVTERGRELAGRLPFEHVHGSMARTVRDQWDIAGAFVLFVATGAAVRVVAPLLGSKSTDPAVVCVDEAGRFAVALCGGHAGGANELAEQVSSQLAAVAVITTATDAAGVTALDRLAGFTAGGDIAAVTTALLDGRQPLIDNPLEWPVPGELRPERRAGAGDGAGPERIVITDRNMPHVPGTALLHPPSLVAGVGCSSGAPSDEVSALISRALNSAGLSPASLAEVATIGLKAGEPAIRALGLPLRTFPAQVLAAVKVPTPSEAVRSAVGTPSVAEAAALTAAGTGSDLVVPKLVSNHATVAIARRLRPRGHLSVVGLGPGAAEHRTHAAEDAVRQASVVIGYGPYVDQCRDVLTAKHEVIRSAIGEEAVRAKQALDEAGAGRRVALVCSGDPGVYAMASLVTEMAGAAFASDFDLEITPGVTAALAAAARLGAPLGHDHAVISLSDLLTPWDVIERRLRAAAQSDMVVALYNPRSGRRSWQLDAARRTLLEHRPPATPVGVVTDVARPGERLDVTTLEALDPTTAGMTTVVIVGSTTTRVAGSRMVTPRGYAT